MGQGAPPCANYSHRHVHRHRHGEGGRFISMILESPRHHSMRASERRCRRARGTHGGGDSEVKGPAFCSLKVVSPKTTFCWSILKCVPCL